MSGWTDKGIYNLLNIVLRSASAPASFYVALATSASAPTKNTNTFNEVTEIAAGNGYTSGGLQVNRNTTDFDTLNESDPVVAQLKDLIWNASGGNLPASGSGARYALLLDDNATVGSREVWAWWDLQAERVVSSGQSLTLQNCELNFDLP